MERIKQALEKAREDRLRTGQPSGMGGLHTTATPVTQISYSQTRTQQVQKHFLREQRVMIGQGTDASVNAYGILRTQILQRLADNGGTHWPSPARGQMKARPSLPSIWPSASPRK